MTNLPRAIGTTVLGETVVEWNNGHSATPRCLNTERPLTHSLDYTEEGLAMKATRKPPGRVTR